jgi:hypothetical protein
MDDKGKYLDWLEEMWNVQKFDVPGSTEHEEKRKEEVLEIFEGLGNTVWRGVKPPDFSPWNPTGDGRDGRSPKAP